MNLPEQTHGALIEQVVPNSPAAKGGLHGGTSSTVVQGDDVRVGGDIVISVDGNSVQRFDDLTSYLFLKTTVGQTVTLTVLRNGQPQQIQIMLTARPNTPSTNTGTPTPRP